MPVHWRVQRHREGVHLVAGKWGEGSCFLVAASLLPGAPARLTQTWMCLRSQTSRATMLDRFANGDKRLTTRGNEGQSPVASTSRNPQ
jgi:hypothetical protein